MPIGIYFYKGRKPKNTNEELTHKNILDIRKRQRSKLKQAKEKAMMQHHLFDFHVKEGILLHAFEQVIRYSQREVLGALVLIYQ